MSEDKYKALQITAKILASILSGLFFGLLAYLIFGWIVFSIVAAPLMGGLTVGAFFAPIRYRKPFASILVSSFFVGLFVAALMQVEAAVYEAFFRFVAGLAGLLGLIAFAGIILILISVSKTDNPNVHVPHANFGIALVIFLSCLGVYFIANRAANFFEQSEIPPQASIVPIDKKQETRVIKPKETAREKEGDSDKIQTKAELAQTELVDSEKLLQQWLEDNPEPMRPDIRPRIFVDSSGAFSVNGRVVDLTETQLTLDRLDNAKRITVPLNLLSQLDQEFLQESYCKKYFSEISKWEEKRGL
ncbi:MAG: SHD1 domain-containing protein [Pirellulaceae bacterium]